MMLVLMAGDVLFDSHNGQIWFPVSGAQQAQADVPVCVNVLRESERCHAIETMRQESPRKL